MDLHNLLPSKEEVMRVLAKPAHELPAMPPVAVRLLRLTGSEDAGAIDLVRVVETDPAIAARVLKLINSAGFALPHAVSSLAHAVVLLGFSAIRAIALDVALFERLTAKKAGGVFDRNHFWQHCLAVASLGRAIARSVDYPDPEEAYAAGLLHDLGKIVIEACGRVRYHDFLEHLPRIGGNQLIAAETGLIGMGHHSLGAWFAARWQFPPTITAVILGHHLSRTPPGLTERESLLTAIIALADFLTWGQGLGSVTVPALPPLHPEIERRIPLAKLDFGELLTEMDREVRDVGLFYHCSFPSSHEFRANLLRTSIELGRHLRPGGGGSCATPGRSFTVAHRSLLADEIIPATLQAIRQDFHFDRIHYLEIGAAERSLGRIAVEPAFAPSPPCLATLEVGDSPAVINCLRGAAPVVVTDGHAGDSRLLDCLACGEIGMAPVLAQGKSRGLILVDNWLSGQPLSGEDMRAIAIVAAEMGAALENARLYEEAQGRAERDGLTGLYNRATIEGKLIDLVGRGDEVSIGLLDIDFFKRFNDTYGHQTGDAILRLIAAAMKKLSRPGDAVGRYGGEEFLILLPATPNAHACRFGERLRAEIENLGHLLRRRFPRCPLTVSIGVATLTAETDTHNQLLEAADQALYRAKHAGRNRVVSAHRFHEVPRTAAAGSP
ncbi:MAG: HDOD domain-containing protein [Thermodesulfobacteriota bacterium]